MFSGLLWLDLISIITFFTVTSFTFTFVRDSTLIWKNKATDLEGKWKPGFILSDFRMCTRLAIHPFAFYIIIVSSKVNQAPVNYLCTCCQIWVILWGADGDSLSSLSVSGQYESQSTMCGSSKHSLVPPHSLSPVTLQNKLDGLQAICGMDLTWLDWRSSSRLLLKEAQNWRFFMV